MGAAILLAVFLPRYFGAGVPKLVKANIPLIRTTLHSDEDGKDYTVQSLFTVEMDSKTRRMVTNNNLYDLLSDIVSQMDFKELAAVNGVDYMNRFATTELNKRLSEITETKTDVYAYNFIIGDRVQFSESSNQVDEFLGGLSNRD